MEYYNTEAFSEKFPERSRKILRARTGDDHEFLMSLWILADEVPSVFEKWLTDLLNYYHNNGGDIGTWITHVTGEIGNLTEIKYPTRRVIITRLEALRPEEKKSTAEYAREYKAKVDAHQYLHPHKHKDGANAWYKEIAAKHGLNWTSLRTAYTNLKN